MDYNLPEEEPRDRNRGRSLSEASMKDGIVLSFVCVLVIVAIGMWSSGVDPFQALPTPTLRSSPWVVEADPHRSSKPTRNVTPNVKTSPSKPRQANEVVPVEAHPVETPQPVALAAVATPQIAPPVVRPREFPIPEQIHAGSKRAQIMDQYGSPSLVTTTHGDGHVVENLIYSKADGAGETVIRIEDGKVLSAYSK